MGPIAWRRPSLAVVFLDAALRYWLTVFPLARWEAYRWRRRARAIPDPVLRGIALDTSRTESRNLEGAAAFAAFAPLRHRPAAVRASVAFQATYDYVDSLAEQPARAPSANARALHDALRVALCPGAAHTDYYRHREAANDGGYLHLLVDACREAMRVLPSQRLVDRRLGDAATRMIAYQAHIHGREDAAPELAAWARTQTPSGTGLAWWEAAAAAASSLVAFALITAAADPELASDDADAIEHAYFPWGGALHVLLDSLVDQPADVASGHRSLVACYARPEETAERLGAIARTAFAAAFGLRRGARHALLLAAMSAFYLSLPSARLSHAAPARERVLTAAGDLAGPALAVMRVRRGGRRGAAVV